MKLLHFSTSDNPTPRLGIWQDDGVIDVAAAAQQLNQSIPAILPAVLAQGISALNPLLAQTNTAISATDIHYHPCMTPPEKIICVGLNYLRHAQESGMGIPETPVLFSKFNNSLAAHQDDIPLAKNATEYDYEVELGVVIGKEARYVSEADALDYIFGYCTINDLSVRDLQMRTSQWLLGKTPDKFLPIGPYLVSADEVADPQTLTLSCWVNGERRQHSSTSDMIFSVAQIISYISQYMTLKPGDVISTGTPEGVILGMEPKVWLKAGDEVSVEVEGLGKLTNHLVDEAN